MLLHCSMSKQVQLKRGWMLYHHIITHGQTFAKSCLLFPSNAAIGLKEQLPSPGDKTSILPIVSDYKSMSNANKYLDMQMFLSKL